MEKTPETTFSILALCLLCGAIFLITTLIYPLAPLTADTPMWITRTITDSVQQSCNIKSSTGGTCSGAPSAGCTVFTVSKGDQVFFGGNNDWFDPDSYYWVDPGDTGRYGAIWIGPPDDVQQGVNEVGLAYDANGLPRVDTNPHLERKPVLGSYSDYAIQILQECATVDEVIAWVNTHQWHSYMHAQLHFADPNGDAVIISAGTDGELVFTRKPRGDSYLVSTNFNVANPANRNGDYPCWRYETATERLSELVSMDAELSAQDATDVLDAVHTEGSDTWTIGSIVADLPNGLVYLYTYHQFEEPVVLNVAEEIANPPVPGSMNRLFPEEVQQEAARRYQRALSNQACYSKIGKAWLGSVLASLVLMVGLSLKNPRGWVFWLPVVTVLGPLGLLVWLVTGRKQKSKPWQAALVEAAGDVIPTTLTFLLMLVVLLYVPGADSNQLLLNLFFFGLPLLFGWLLFQGPLLALTTHQSYLRMLGQRLLPAWVAANLGMGGINAISMPLVKWILNTCSLHPLSLWALVSLWAVVVAGACVAILLLLLYEGWSVPNGYRAWSILACGDDVVSSPSRRRLWWWFLLSFVALFGGVVVSEMIQQLF